MDMSVNPDGMNSTDYSDFEYQQIYHEHEQRDLTGSPAKSEIQSEYEPLGGIGGLDNNEVAELVYFRLTCTIEHDQQDSDQDVGSETSIKGVFGANLPASKSVIPANQENPTTTVIDSNGLDTVVNEGGTSSDDRIFTPFEMGKNAAFDDQTNGPGGAGSTSPLVLDMPYRQVVGRGPVLDSSDDVTLVTALTQEDEIIGAQANIAIHCVWDTAEVSDAGRAFSVPK